MLWVIKETYNNISVEIEEEKHKADSVGGVQSLSPWGNSEWTNNSHTIISITWKRLYRYIDSHKHQQGYVEEGGMHLHGSKYKQNTVHLKTRGICTGFFGFVCLFFPSWGLGALVKTVSAKKSHWWWKSVKLRSYRSRLYFVIEL